MTRAAPSVVNIQYEHPALIFQHAFMSLLALTAVNPGSSTLAADANIHSRRSGQLHPIGRKQTWRGHKEVSHNQVSTKSKTGLKESAEWEEQSPSHQPICPDSHQIPRWFNNLAKGGDRSHWYQCNVRVRWVVVGSLFIIRNSRMETDNFLKQHFT